MIKEMLTVGLRCWINSENIHQCIRKHLQHYSHIKLIPWFQNYPEISTNCHFKVTATSLTLEIRLHAHQVGTNTRSGTEVMFTLLWLAHAFGSIGYFVRSLISGLDNGAATLKWYDRHVVLFVWDWDRQSLKLIAYMIVYKLLCHDYL